MLERKSNEMRPGMGSVRVLGIDPGTRVVGFGVLEQAATGKTLVVAHGVVRLAPSPMCVRLAQLFRALEELITAHHPSVLAIERVFHGKNFQSILKVGEARGVVALAGQLGGCEVREYTPAMVKKVVAGNGNASKLQVQRMVVRLLELAVAPEPFDATDALAIAHCHVLKSRWRERLDAAGASSAAGAELVLRNGSNGAPRGAPAGPARAAGGPRDAKGSKSRIPRPPAGGRRGAARWKGATAGLDLEGLLASGKAAWLERDARSRNRS